MFARVYSLGFLQSSATRSVHLPTVRTFDASYAAGSATLACYVSDAWRRLDSHEALTPDLDRLRAYLSTMRDVFAELCLGNRVTLPGQMAVDYGRAALGIVPSYVHMTNNRLGITRLEESYLAHVLVRALGAAPSSETTG